MTISVQIATLNMTAFADVAPATVFYDVLDQRFQPSDFTGTVTRASQVLRITAPLPMDGFENCAPGARVRWRVTMAGAGQMEVCVRYTGLVTRNDAYLPIAPVLIDGVQTGRFVQTKALPATPHPVGDVVLVMTVPPGQHDIELVMPTCASMDMKYIRLPPDAVLNAMPARPSKRLVVFGDSRAHGFNASSPNIAWPYRLAELKGAQIVNIGRGGRQVTASDGTIAGAVGADAGVYLCDFNDFYPNGANLTTWGAAYRAVASNFRTASIAAGKPFSRLYMLTSLDAPAALAGGTYAANSPTLEAFRARARVEIAALADPYTSIIEGLGGGMPTGIGQFSDGVHPDDAAHATIASVLAPQVVI